MKRFSTRTCVTSLVVVALASVATAASFDANFADYAAGEVLSQKGTTGGAWQLQVGGGVPSTVEDGGRMALNILSPKGLVFAADEEPNGPLETMDYTFAFAGFLTDPGEVPTDTLATFSPGRFPDGRTGFYAVGDGRWQELSSDGLSLAIGDWVSVRVAFRMAGDVKFVSYFVRRGEVWTQLANPTGRTWFRAGKSDRQTRESEFVGTCRLASLAGEDREGESPRTLYWVGGTDGDFTDTNGWSLERDGEPSGFAPQAGDVALLTGGVMFSDGTSSAMTHDLALEIGEDGSPSIIGGSVESGLSVDVSRPRIGKPLEVTSTGLFDYRPKLLCNWTRGDFRKAWEREPLSTGASYSPTTDDCEHWLRVTAEDGSGGTLAKEFYFSTLPVCYVTTLDGLTPTAAKEEHEASVTIQGNADYKLQYDGLASVKVRGNSTKNYVKKPYKLKLDKKTSLFGIPKNKHWVLLANYNDLSQLRNKLAYDFANEIGNQGMRSTWVQCVLNGDFIGTYQLCEHIRVGSDRVNIYDWEDEAGSYGASDTDFSAIDRLLETAPGSVDISGGYLFEFSEEYDELTKFTINAGKLEMRTMLNKPEYLYTSARMTDFCRDFLQNYFDACTSADRKSAGGRHYSEYCDVDSMVSFFLVNELFANNDATKKSRYAHLDRGGKLVWGPVWDFDWGSQSIVTGDNSEEWACAKDAQGESSRKYSMFKEWASDFYFCKRLRAKYQAVRERYAAIFADGGDVDRYAKVLQHPCETNDARWPRERTFGEDIKILKAYHARRLVWLDRQFETVDTLIESLHCSIQTNPSTYDSTAMTDPTTDSAGNVVPAVPLDWLRAAGEGADPSYGYASKAELQEAVVKVPSVWGKPVALWQDYVAGTDPDPASPDAMLRITKIGLEGGMPVIKWQPDLGSKRLYTIEGTENLVSPNWHERTSADRFFRVRVDIP